MAGGDDSSALVEALSLEGDWLMFGGVPKRAAVTLDEALCLQPDHVMSLIRRALVYSQMQDTDKSVELLESARQLDPQNCAAAYFLAQVGWCGGALWLMGACSCMPKGGGHG